MTNLFDLSGRVVLVAGGGGYLGRPICAALAAHGAHVVVADIQPDAAEAAAAEVRDAGHAASAMHLDIADEAAIDRAIDTVVADHGGLHGTVNCTHFSRRKTLEAGTADDWQAGLRVTLTGAFSLTRAAGRYMAEHGGGSIVHFASMYGVVSPDPRAYVDGENPNPPDYGAAKAGVLQLARYQAVAWAKQGVRVNTIVPGPFPFPQMQADKPGFMEQLASRVPMGRIGQAPETAGAVVFLLSDAASYITGIAVPVDGGWTAW